MSKPAPEPDPPLKQRRRGPGRPFAKGNTHGTGRGNKNEETIEKEESGPSDLLKAMRIVARQKNIESAYSELQRTCWKLKSDDPARFITTLKAMEAEHRKLAKDQSEKEKTGVLPADEPHKRIALLIETTLATLESKPWETPPPSPPAQTKPSAKPNSPSSA